MALRRKTRPAPIVPTEDAEDAPEKPYQQRISENHVLRTHRFPVREVAHPFHAETSVLENGAGIYSRGVDTSGDCERCNEDARALTLALEDLVNRARRADPEAVCHADVEGTQNLCTAPAGHSGPHRCTAEDVDARKTGARP